MDALHSSERSTRWGSAGRGSRGLVVAMLVSVAAHVASALLQGRAHAAAPASAVTGPATALIEVVSPPPPDDPRVSAPAVPATSRPLRTRPTAGRPSAARARATERAASPLHATDERLPAATGPEGAGGAAGVGTGEPPTSPPVDLGGETRAAPVRVGAAPPPDRSALARALASEWSCPFPDEADANDRHQAVVTIEVSVAADGSVSGVRVLEDPGSGFGRAARLCAARQRFAPALDRAGGRSAGTTRPIRVRFSR